MPQNISSVAHTGSPQRIRDLRLDFFRGLGLYIILIAHITNNPWTLFIPARFGFSDATEMFVFCSGMASAVAFGSVFTRSGYFMGCLRVMQRVWEVYWVHIVTFMLTLTAMLVINKTGLFARDEVGALNLVPFLKSSGNNVIGLFTLTYVPNYFDILPMYLVILAMIPVMMLLARLHAGAAVAFSLLMWLSATFYDVNLPAELWFSNGSKRQWFFNPFAWQLVFFTGFAFMSGWLPAPPRKSWLIIAAVAVVIATIPFAWHVAIAELQPVQAWRKDWRILFDKTDFGILRFIHFLALAYLAWIAVGPAGERLQQTPFMRLMTRIFVRTGQQSLAVFATSIVLARVLGAFLHLGGGTAWAAFLINTLGFVLIYLTAVLVGYFKGQPWKAARPARAPDAAAASDSKAPHLAVVS